ncbi:MAG: recombination mediator RecR [Propionibacteriaceae bacterium]|nr:recombination mediator RecR [Propionibacteriaceae bacterium]
MNVYEGPVQDVIDQLGRLPGIGPVSAQRIAFWLLDQPADDVHQLAEALTTLKQKVRWCSVCFNVSQDELCRICSDPRRDRSAICVVEESKDVAAIERTHEFKGLYHVLGGSLSPIEGRGPNELHLRELVNRLADQQVTEVILATNPNVKGDVTATYITRLLKDLPGVRVTRLASGLPVGGELEYADAVTLGRAFNGRQWMTS